MWSSAWGGFVDGLKSKPSVEIQEAPLTWSALVAFLFLGGLTLGFIRLCAGYILLAREVKHASELDHTSARELLDGLLMEQDHYPFIQLRQTKRLSTAAVVGWWRPVILLPEVWNTWSTDQLKAVLTHELSHILQRDFLSNLCAEISRSIYFYHPLMHWMVARLRLEQELVADAAAAEAAGGPEPYLVILAEMAMAHSDRGVRGPARAFLPTHSTFLRRIDMLKEKRPVRGTASRSARAVIVAASLLMGMVAVGLRGDRISIAQDAPNSVADSGGRKKTTEKFRIDFVPHNALGVIAFRPAMILAQDSMKPIRTLIDQENSKISMFDFLGLKMTDMKTETIVFLPPDTEGNTSQNVNRVTVIQMEQAIDLESVLKEFSNSKIVNATTTTILGKTCFKANSGNEKTLLFLNDQTLVFTDNQTSMHDIIDAMQSGGASRWEKQWKSIETNSVAGLIDMRVARAIVGDEQVRIVVGNTPVLEIISPIWENTELATLGLTIDQKISLHIWLSQFQNSDRVRDTLDAVLTLTRNILDRQKERLGDHGIQERLMLMTIMNVAEQSFKSTTVTQEGEAVTLRTSITEDSGAQLIATLVPALMQAQVAANRMHSMNNIKQIVLALHIYHDKYKHFPPAVLLGPDGKTQYSWRVALLPFLGQQALYDEYNRNEPWDSEENKKVLAQMPAVFRCPIDNRNQNDSGYFVIAGDNTAFGNYANRGETGASGGGVAAGVEFGGGEIRVGSIQNGVRLSDIIDGTTNTIAVVEAKREIPWTKPEDITYDGEQLPKLGGFYPGGINVGFCDGAARFLSEKIAPTTMKNLIQRNDGKIVSFNVQ